MHTETKFSPYEPVFGKICKFSSNWTESIDPIYNFDDFPKEIAKGNLITSKLQRHKQINVKRNVINYNVGQRFPNCGPRTPGGPQYFSKGFAIRCERYIEYVK